MLLADTLSRLPLAHNVTKVPVVDMVQVNTLSEFSGCDSLLQEIASHHDADISLLKRYITDGWPSCIPTKLLPYSKAHQEYTIQAGIVYRGCCVVPPKSLRPRNMNILHRDHPGIVRMIRLARQYFWWPNIDSSINSFVQRCKMCQLNARKRTSAHLKSWDEAHHFFERVHIDVAHYADKKYLVIVDAFSKWLDVQPLTSTSSLSAISALHSNLQICWPATMHRVG